MHIIGKIIEENQTFINMNQYLVLIGKPLNLSLIIKMDAKIKWSVINVMAGKKMNIILKIIELSLAQTESVKTVLRVEIAHIIIPRRIEGINFIFWNYFFYFIFWRIHTFFIYFEEG